MGRDPPPASGGGVPKKEIARRLQLDVKTVRRAVDQPTPPARVSPPRASSLDPWRDRIEQWLREDRKLTPKRIRRVRRCRYAHASRPGGSGGVRRPRAPTQRRHFAVVIVEDQQPLAQAFGTSSTKRSSHQPSGWAT